MLRPCVEIHIQNSVGHCGGCGPYSKAEAQILLPGGASVTINHDGHAGRTDWNGKDPQLCLFVLGLMGLVPTIDGEEADMPRLRGSRVHILRSDYEQINIDLEMSEEDGYGERHIELARWVGPDSLRALKMGPSRGLDHLWIALANSLIDFEIEREGPTHGSKDDLSITDAGEYENEEHEDNYAKEEADYDEF